MWLYVYWQFQILMILSYFQNQINNDFLCQMIQSRVPWKAENLIYKTTLEFYKYNLVYIKPFKIIFAI